MLIYRCHLDLEEGDRQNFTELLCHFLQNFCQFSIYYGTRVSLSSDRGKLGGDRE